MTSTWFDFLKSVKQTADSGMTTLVIPEALQNQSLQIPLPLDWWIHVGGAIRTALEIELERAIKSSENKVGLVLEIRMKPDPVLKFEIASWLTESRHGIEQIQILDEGWRKQLGSAQITACEVTHEPLDWYRRLDLPAVDTKLKSDFVSEITDAAVDLSEPPWVFWSRFPPWLKRREKKIDVFELDRRLTFLRVALSPQDEPLESKTLSVAQLMVNPTFEYVESAVRAQGISAFARFWDSISHRAITELEAAILDEVRESFRIDRASLLMRISHERNVRKEFVNAAIDGLIADFFLLGHENLVSRDQ